MVEILDGNGGQILVTDAAFDAILDVRGGAAHVDVDALTTSERWQVARALGWVGKFSTAYLAQWAGGPDAPATPAGPDYEGAILARQEVRHAGE